jgi:hypothetical protein
MAGPQFTRRDLFKLAAGTGAVAALGGGTLTSRAEAAAPPLDTGTLTKYLDPLPIMPLARPSRSHRGGNPLYEVRMVQFHQRLHAVVPRSRSGDHAP